MTDSDTPLHERKQFDKVLCTQSFTAKWSHQGIQSIEQKPEIK